jgi:hypothetical protein
MTARPSLRLSDRLSSIKRGALIVRCASLIVAKAVLRIFLLRAPHVVVHPAKSRRLSHLDSWRLYKKLEIAEDGTRLQTTNPLVD